MHSVEQWERLLSALRAAHGPVSAESGSIRLTTPLVELVITPRNWDDMVSIPYGSIEPAVENVLRRVEEVEPGTPYLVYHQYDLQPSQTRVLPPDGPDPALIEELRRSNPDATFRWVARRADHPPSNEG